MKNSEWFDYLLDSLEVAEDLGPLKDTHPIDRKGLSPQLTQEYFAKNWYPFAERLDMRTYLLEKRALQVELVKLQNWVKERGERVVIVFEGRDAAGKGSTIKRFMEHLNPRGARVVALEKPSEQEQGQMVLPALHRPPAHGG